MMTYKNLDAFNKEFKKLSKRFITLEEDFKTFKKYALETFFGENKIDTKSFVKIEGLCNEQYTSYKVLKFACKALKNRGNKSGIRIIFVKDNNSGLITFVEIYFKGDKENEDKEYIKEFLQFK